MTEPGRARGGLLTLAMAMAIGVAGSASAGSALPASPASDHARTSDHARLRAVLQRITTVDGAPGALAEVRTGRGGGTVLTSGVADVQSRTPVRGDSRFRLGSMTKPFVATVLLQLAGERRVRLDAPVERYLPGVVRGHGNDGRAITVRQLLQHTSGLPDFLQYLRPQEIVADPLARRDTRDLLDIALAHPPTFEPGTGWRYSNTGYLVIGMIIEKVTGRSYGDEIRRRVIRPLRLHDTFAPGDASGIPGPHPRGYARPGPDAPLVDVTAVSPTIGGAAGELISSASDVNRFMAALLHGALLRPAQQREMMRTRPTGGSDGRAYGLGLESSPLPCGGLYWGHTGDFLGYETATGIARGRQVTVMANLGPGASDAQSDDIEAAVETALCEGRRTSNR
ncbi:serine hydrolase [Streptomyces sp. WAC 04229]|uniref:serine hydrolase domain-containing protein n=1 Tax=Streptomyces sp. WAC 04229 TaxID=2203206 RepID=UPI0021ADA9FC|nr:serine hydrolase domain-containing protein [Streptomyces sp. WAC 04229]